MTPEQEWRQLLLGEIKEIRKEVAEARGEVAVLRSEVESVKSDVNVLKVKSALIGSIIGSVGTYIANKLL
jgi:archaellum component FlaC